jgi:hypothetical protein
MIRQEMPSWCRVLTKDAEKNMPSLLFFSSDQYYTDTAVNTLKRGLFYTHALGRSELRCSREQATSNFYK